MAAAKPPSTKAATTASRKPAKKGQAPAPTKRGPAAHVTASAEAARQRLADAKGLPGWRGARLVIGEALAADATAVLVEAQGKAVAIRRRAGAAWQPRVPLAGDDAIDVFRTLAKLAPAAAGHDDPGFVVSAGKIPRRSCRVEARKGLQGDQVIVLVGPELPRPERRDLVRDSLGRLWQRLRSFVRRPPPPERDPTLPLVELEATGPEAEARTATAAEADGYVAACDLVAAAVRDRAGTIIITGGPQGVAVQFDVDGVVGAFPGVDPAEVVALVGALKAVAGIDPKAGGTQAGRITATVQGKAWPCTVDARRGKAGERVQVTLDRARPKFKTLADTGLAEEVVGRIQEFLKLESGLILLVAPPGNGLTTLCDAVIGAADRLLRDFVLLEDEAAPRPEMQNVKPFRWDSRTGGKPGAALEAALREYPNVLATCDLEDPELATRLVAQAGENRLVIVGIRGIDAADGIARLASLGVDRRALSRVLLGAVGVRLVRKLCPACRREYFPPLKVLPRFELDPDATITLFTAPPGGCPVCTGTGYLGRTVASELAAGATLRPCLEKTADAQAIRDAAVAGGTVTLRRDAAAKAARGITSVEEVARVFADREEPRREGAQR